MKEIIQRATAWLTPGKRAALYAIAVAIVPLAQNITGASDDVSQAWLTITGIALQVIAGTLMLANLSFAGAASWFSDRGRAAIYGAFVSVAPALQTIGLFSPAQTDAILTYVSQGLGILAAIVAALYVNPITPEPDAVVYVGRNAEVLDVEVPDPE